MSDKKYSRRSLIQLGGFAGLSFDGGVDSLISMILKNFVSRAVAEETNQQSSMNFVNIGLLGAPLRYQFDHWLRTNANDPQTKFTMITGSKYQFSNGKVSGVDHGYFNHNGVLVPHLFSQNVNISSGNKQIADLLKHMTVIRGYGTGLDGHPTNLVRQMSPVGGLPSLAGLAADSNSRIFDAIQWPARGGYHSFNSAKSKSINILNVPSNPAKSLLEGFGKPNPAMMTARNLVDRNKEAVDLARRRLATYINAEHPGSKILAKNNSNAMAMIKKGIDNLDAYWAPAVDRYHLLIANAMKANNIPGISDSPLIFDTTSSWSSHFTEITGDNKHLKLWKVGSGPEMFLNLNYDFREAFANSFHNYLAEGLALCEYVLTEELCSSLEIHFGSLPIEIMLHGQSTKQVFSQDNDMHATGSVAAIFLMNQYYRGMCAGVLELIEKLKNKTIKNSNVWSKTLIQFSSEFERSVRPDGTGSDHGYNQMVSSVLSGAVTNGPHVVGNIYTTPSIGTQGIAAPIDGYTIQGMPTPTIVAATTAAILQIEENPYENVAAPLCEFENGVLKNKFPGKIVEGG